jgi:hypothetical protein
VGRVSDLVLRRAVYDHFAELGAAPSIESVVGIVGDEVETRAALRRLHDGHMLVLGSDGEIAMALPFAASRTGHRVVAADRSWWVNCAWDSLAAIAALGVDAAIEATWLDTGDRVELAVAGGRLSDDEGFIHFRVPARHWWDDIAET